MSPKDLNAFIIWEESRGKFKCAICGKLFSRKEHLWCHLESIHFPNSFLYSCDMCHKSFNTKNKLYKHKIVHR